MNILEMISVLEEVMSSYSALKTQGIFTEVEDVAAKLEANPDVQAIATKLEGLFAKKA